MNLESPLLFVILFAVIIVSEFIDYFKTRNVLHEENLFYTSKKRRTILSLFAIAFLLLFLGNVMDLTSLQYIGCSVLIIAGLINVFFMWKEYKFVGIIIFIVILLSQYLLFL